MFSPKFRIRDVIGGRTVVESRRARGILQFWEANSYEYSASRYGWRLQWFDQQVRDWVEISADDLRRWALRKKKWRRR